MTLLRSALLACCLALVWAPAVQAQMDITKLIKAPPSFPIGKGAKVGHRAEVLLKAGGTEIRHFTAIVGETEDAWELETNQLTASYGSFPDGKELLMALVVDKKSGEVLQARVGKPGEELEDVEIMESAETPKPKEPAGEEVEFTLPSGKKVKATKTVTKAGGNTYTTWVGRKGGDLEGILLKSSGTNYDKELSEDPSEVDYELEDKDAAGKPRTVVGRRVAFSDQSVMIMSSDPVATSVAHGLLSMVQRGATIEVRSLRTDAKKTLSWK